MKHNFNHERLDAYTLAIQVNRWLDSTTFPKHRSHIKDQALRASDSIVLNIAEGVGRDLKQGRAGRNHLRMALGSAAECCAALDCVTVKGGADNQVLLRRIAAMLVKLGA